MVILTRQERERLVRELYNQGKTYREIAKEARISPRDIGIILNKVIEEKTKGSKEEAIKQQDDNVKQNKQQEQHLSLAAQAYKLFSACKNPLEVAIELNLRESEATKFYKEYWKLKQLHNLSMVYEELRNDIEPFLKLYKLAKRKGMAIKQVVNLLEMSNNDLPSLEERFKRLRNDVSMLQFRKQTLERNLYQLNNQIAISSRLLNFYRLYCENEKSTIEQLHNEQIRIENLVTRFKNNNEEYLYKIKQTAEEKVKDVLTNGKLILKFATLSVIESLRSNPELYNFIMYDISNNAAIIYGSNYPSLMLSGGRQQQQSFNDSYTALILEESEKLYNKLMTELTNRVISAVRATSLPSLTNNNEQTLTHKNDRY